MQDVQPKVNKLEEQKARNTAAIADVTKNTLQYIRQEVGCRADVYRDTDGAHCDVLHT